MVFESLNAGICAVSGQPNACVFVEADGNLEGAYGSRYDTLRFVWLGAPPAALAPHDRVCDDVVATWIDDGQLAPYASVMNGPLPVRPNVFRLGFAADRPYAEARIAKMLAGEIPVRQVLSSFLDTSQTPDPYRLALLDVLVAAAMGKAPGVDELFEPWLEQRRLRNELNKMLSPDTDDIQPESDDKPMRGHVQRIVDRT